MPDRQVEASGTIRDDAYHGTRLENALKIQQQGFMPHLGIAGAGCYFDLGNDESARTFALDRARGDLEQAVVIRAAIHLGPTLDFSFRRNPEVRRQFQQFQAELEQRSTLPYGLTFNEEKERFLQERYPQVTAVFYFNERTGLWYVAVRDSQRIRILSMDTLSGKEHLVHPLNTQRACDQCLFMADTFHPDMCLHPGRRDPGALGDTLDRALHWNGPCPMQQHGRPVFYALLTLACPVEEWDAAGEYMRVRIARHLALHSRITAEDIHQYTAEYRHARAVVGARTS